MFVLVGRGEGGGGAQQKQNSVDALKSYLTFQNVYCRECPLAIGCTAK